MQNFQFHISCSVFALLFVLPRFAAAHGGVDDGHAEEAVVSHASGASALLESFSAEWWGLLIVSLVITAGLSYSMWRFLQVPIKKS